MRIRSTAFSKKYAQTESDNEWYFTFKKFNIVFQHQLFKKEVILNVQKVTGTKK